MKKIIYLLILPGFLFGQGLTPTALTVFTPGNFPSVSPDAGVQGGCAAGELTDCVGNCFDPAGIFPDWVGDGFCDDGSFGVVFTCAAFDFDSTDPADCELSDCFDVANCAAGAEYTWDGVQLTTDGCNPCASTGIATIPVFTLCSGILPDIAIANSGQIACDYVCGTISVTYSVAVGSLEECLGMTMPAGLVNPAVEDWFFPPTGTWGYTITAGACGALPTITPTDCPISFTGPTETVAAVDGSCAGAACPAACNLGAPDDLVPGTPGTWDITNIQAVTAFPVCFTGIGAETGAIAPCDPDCCVGPPGSGCPIIPIELVQFRGKTFEGYNILEWSTASEINNQWQILERSYDGREYWTEIDRVEGHMNSNTIHNYTVYDKNPLEVGYYRIRSVDFDGHQEVSNVISLRQNVSTVAIGVNPNPFSDFTNVTVEYSENALGKISVLDISGRLMFSDRLDLVKGVSSKVIDLSNFGKRSLHDND